MPEPATVPMQLVVEVEAEVTHATPCDLTQGDNTEESQ